MMIITFFLNVNLCIVKWLWVICKYIYNFYKEDVGGGDNPLKTDRVNYNRQSQI